MLTVNRGSFYPQYLLRIGMGGGIEVGSEDDGGEEAFEDKLLFT
jgi:hypothetical protein